MVDIVTTRGFYASELTNAEQLAQVAQDQAKLDSNDDEIDALREALEFTLGLLGIDLPEGREPCDWCGEKPAVKDGIDDDRCADCKDYVLCKECKANPAEEFDMCGSCIHDARRSGWNPPST